MNKKTLVVHHLRFSKKVKKNFQISLLDSMYSI